MGFLKFLDEAKDKLTGEAKSVGQAFALPLGFTVDIARHAPGTDFLDNSFFSNFSTQHSLGGAADVLVGDNTLSGWGITQAGQGLNTAYQYGIENPIETAWYHADTNSGKDPLSWSQAWDLAKHRSLGQTAELVANDSINTLGDKFGFDPDAAVRGIPLVGSYLNEAGIGAPRTKDVRATDPDAWTEFQKNSPFWSGLIASTADITAQFAADPFVLASKATSGVRLAHTLRPVKASEEANLLDLMQTDRNGILTPLKGPGLASRTDKLIGTVDYEAKMSSRGRPLQDVNGDEIRTAVTGKAGWLDGKSWSEVYHGLGLHNLTYGGDLAVMLANTNHLDNVVDKVNARRLLLATMGGDPRALRELNATLPEYGYKFSNMMRGRGTGEIDAALADNANADAIANGTELPKFAQPETVAAVKGEVESLPNYYEWLSGMTTDRTLAVSAKADRTVARLRQQGLGRDGTLHTGHSWIDNTIGRLINGGAKSDGSIVDDTLVNDPEMVGKRRTEGIGSGQVNQPEQGFFLNGPSSMPVRFLRTSALRVAGWASGVTPYQKLLKGSASASNALRERVVYGTLNLEDGPLAVAVTQGMLRRSGMDATQADKHLSAVVGTASNPTALGEAVNRAQTAALRAIAERHGIDQDTVEALAVNGGRLREGFQSSLKGQNYSAATRDDGSRIDHVFFADTGGTAVLPVTRTQNPNSVDLLDLDYAEKWLKRDDHLRALGEYFRGKRDGGNPIRNHAEQVGLRSPIVAKMQAMDTAFIRDATERTNTLWKASVLLTRPVSYAVRNTAEEIMRVAALGHTATAVEIAARQVPAVYRDLPKALRRKRGIPDEHRFWMSEAHGSLGLHKQELEDLKALHTDPEILANVKSIKGELRSLTRQRAAAVESGSTEEIAELDSAIKFTREMPALAEHGAWADQLKETELRIKDLEDQITKRVLPDSGTRTIEGVPGDFPQAFAGVGGETHFDLVNNSGTFDRNATEYGERTQARLRGIGQPDNISVRGLQQPKDVVAAHLQGWHWTLNKVLRQDDAARVAIKAKADGAQSNEIADAVQEYLDSEAGRAYREGSFRSHNTQAWASDIATMVDHQVMDSETAKVLLDREIKRSELKEAFPESIRPDVHLAAVDTVFGVQSRKMDKVIGRMFERIDKMSVQQMTRHPMFSLYYEAAQNRLARIAQRRVIEERGPEGKLTVDEIDRMSQAARKEAALKLKNTFYDTASRSSAAHQLRFIYPFFAAHQDSMQFWGKAIAQSPHVLRDFQLAFQAPASLGLVIDGDGNPVKPGTALSNDQSVILQMPKAWGGPDPKDPKSKGHGLTVSLSSFNLVTQNGGIFNPGAGPIVAIPAGYIAKKYGARHDEVARAMTWFNPFGAPRGNAGMSLMPTSLKRAFTLYDAHHNQNSMEYTQMWVQRMQEAHIAFVKDHDREPDFNETADLENHVSDQVKHMSLLRWAASWISPVQPRPVSKLQGLQNEYYRLADRGRKEGRGPFWAADTFLDTYGDAYIDLTKSASENRAHLDPTSATVRSLDAHKGLTDKTAPETWAVIVGPEGKGAFSIDAYRWMQSKSTSTVGGEKLVDQKAARQSLFDTQVAAGWREYNKQMDTLQAEATNRGLTSPNQDPQLKQAGKEIRDKIAKDYPQWNSVKMGGSDTPFQKIFESVERISADKSLLRDPARQDIKYLSAYVNARKQVEAALASRQAIPGGSDDINAMANRDIKWEFANYVDTLCEGNIAFGNYAFPNVIERDPYYDPDILTASGAGQ